MEGVEPIRRGHKYESAGNILNEKFFKQFLSSCEAKMIENGSNNTKKHIFFFN
jgi:hypothetical protein